MAQGSAGSKPIPGQVRIGSPQGSGGDDGETSDPIMRYAPPVVRAPTQAPRKPIALRPVQLTGDRDFMIYIECRADGVVLYPSQRLFPAEVLSSSSANSNALAQAVQQMIDRRQASVQPGALPYRPQVCFLVHPDTVRMYHMAYPALDALSVPKVRQNLDHDDDVLAIVTGH
jgi:hypothetical protein